MGSQLGRGEQKSGMGEHILGICNSPGVKRIL